MVFALGIQCSGHVLTVGKVIGPLPKIKEEKNQKESSIKNLRT